MASSNPYQNYKEQSILTMTSGELLLVLYDECIKSLNFAVYYIDEENKPEECEKLIKKTQRIIHYLDGILDYKYEISMNLHMLYDMSKQAVCLSILHRYEQKYQHRTLYEHGLYQGSVFQYHSLHSYELAVLLSIHITA